MFKEHIQFVMNFSYYKVLFLLDFLLIDWKNLLFTIKKLIFEIFAVEFNKKLIKNKKKSGFQVGFRVGNPIFLGSGFGLGTRYFRVFGFGFRVGNPIFSGIWVRVSGLGF